MPKAEPKTASAAASSRREGVRSLGAEIEAAMSKATMDAMKAGVTDDDEIRELKLKARDKVKKEFAAVEAKATAASKAEAKKQAAKKK